MFGEMIMVIHMPRVIINPALFLEFQNGWAPRWASFGKVKPKLEGL